MVSGLLLLVACDFRPHSTLSCFLFIEKTAVKNDSVNVVNVVLSFEHLNILNSFRFGFESCGEATNEWCHMVIKFLCVCVCVFFFCLPIFPNVLLKSKSCLFFWTIWPRPPNFTCPQFSSLQLLEPILPPCFFCKHTENE